MGFLSRKADREPPGSLLVAWPRCSGLWAPTLGRPLGVIFLDTALQGCSGQALLMAWIYTSLTQAAGEALG